MSRTLTYITFIFCQQFLYPPCDSFRISPIVKNSFKYDLEKFPIERLQNPANSYRHSSKLYGIPKLFRWLVDLYPLGDYFQTLFQQIINALFLAVTSSVNAGFSGQVRVSRLL